MKKWTVVIEITDNDDGMDSSYTQAEIEEYVSARMTDNPFLDIGFRIMETIEAPYGPQHPNGVFIKEVKS